MADFDGVVIGAGHNGLTLAAYLSRAGLRIAVLERNSRIGGGSSTEERILPGFKLNLHANFFMGLGLCPLLNDLELHRFGFSYIEPPVQQAAVFRDGTGIVVYKDLDRTCASLARFSKQDAETFRTLWHTYCEEMRPLLVSLLYNAPMPREQLVDRLSGPKAKELLSHAQHDLFSVVRKHFVDERIRTLFTSYMHVITTENVPGAGIVFPAIFANIASFTLPVGGAMSLPLALARIVEAGGGEIVTGADVKDIKVAGGRATGVMLADGRTINGRKFVASAIDFPATVQMAGEELFPEPVREKAKAWHWGNHSLVTLHLALKNPPAYRAAAFDPDVSRAYNIFFGMDHIEDVASCFDDCAAKKFPRILMGNGACNSQFDPSYAPAGQAQRVLVAVRALFGRRLAAGMGAQPRRLHAEGSRLLAHLRLESRRRQSARQLSVHAARRGDAQRQYAPGRGARRRLCSEPARHQPAASVDAGIAHAGGRPLSLRIVVRQRRRHQWRRRLYRGQCHRRRPEAQADVETCSGPGMEALRDV